MSRKRPKRTEHATKHAEKKEKSDGPSKARKEAEKERFLKRIFGDNKKAFALVAAVFFVIGVFVTFAYMSGYAVSGMVVSEDNVGAKVVDYLNNNIVPSGSSVELVSVDDENGIYVVTTSYQGNEIPVYATRDGSLLLIGTAYNLSEEIAPPTQEQTPQETSEVTSCDAVPKESKPRLEAWVVSNCPYGTQAMNGMYYVAKLFGDKVDVVTRYITDVDASGNPTSMHGDAERIENQRQICIEKEQPEKFWDYMHCYVETGDADTCENTTGIDSAKLDECFDSRGADYLIQEAIDWVTVYQPAGGRGSPSFFINGVKVSEYSFDQNGRSPNNLKNIICCGMDTPLEECNEQLNTANPPTGFGKMGETSSSSSGSC
jgi:hypothetical protein